jgi:hypothetical protein
MKTLKPTIFWQDTGIFGDDFVFAIGKNKKQILAFAKKADSHVKRLLEELEDQDLSKELRTGMTLAGRHTNVVALIYLPKMSDTWGSWETLMHECHHAVYHVSKKNGFEEEMEAQAYLFVHLFHNIRRKIMQAQPGKKNG